MTILKQIKCNGPKCNKKLTMEPNQHGTTWHRLYVGGDDFILDEDLDIRIIERIGTEIKSKKAIHFCCDKCLHDFALKRIT